MGVTNNSWIRRGKQKQALVKAMKKPAIASALFKAMRETCPEVQLRDVWFLLRQFEERELMICLTPDEPTGKVYFFTDKGRRLVGTDLGVSIPPAPTNVNWTKYAHVLRAKVRRLALVKFGKKNDDVTVPVLWRELREHGIKYNTVDRTISYLVHLKLIRPAGVGERKNQKLLALTAMGYRIRAEMLRQP